MGVTSKERLTHRVRDVKKEDTRYAFWGTKEDEDFLSQDKSLEKWRKEWRKKQEEEKERRKREREDEKEEKDDEREEDETPTLILYLTTDQMLYLQLFLEQRVRNAYTDGKFMLSSIQRSEFWCKQSHE